MRRRLEKSEKFVIRPKIGFSLPPPPFRVEGKARKCHFRVYWPHRSCSVDTQISDRDAKRDWELILISSAFLILSVDAENAARQSMSHEQEIPQAQPENKSKFNIVAPALEDFLMGRKQERKIANWWVAHRRMKMKTDNRRRCENCWLAIRVQFQGEAVSSETQRSIEGWKVSNFIPTHQSSSDKADSSCPWFQRTPRAILTDEDWIASPRQRWIRAGPCWEWNYDD